MDVAQYAQAMWCNYSVAIVTQSVATGKVNTEHKQFVKLL